MAVSDHAVAAPWLGLGPSRPAVVVCAGDSITRGDTWHPGYPEALRRQLRAVPPPEGRSHWHVENFGKSGATAIRQGSGATPYTLMDTFKEALERDGDFVLIMFGTNDARESTWDARAFTRDLSFIIAQFRRVREASTPPRPPAWVFLLTPPPLYKHRGNSNCLQRVLHDLLPRQILPFIARECGLGLVDLLTPLGGAELLKRELMDRIDGVHPNEHGSEVIARKVCDALGSCARTGELPWQEPPPLSSGARLEDGPARAEAALAGTDGAQLWRVVGGISSDGIVVRQGCALASEAEEERLQVGAELVEVDVRGGRLHYRKLRGDGPDTGWVSIRAQGTLLVEPFRLIETRQKSISAADPKTAR